MANVKITDLTAYTDPKSTDVLPIVDVTNDITKKVDIAGILKNAPAGSASATAFAFDGDPNTGIYSPGADQIALATGGTGQVFVDASGNVGIGTSSPGYKLDVSGSARVKTGATGTPFIVASGGDSQGFLRFGSTGGGGAYGIYGGADYLALQFHTEGTERLRIDSSGRLLVGTSSDSGGSLLQVNDNRIRIASSKTPASATDTGAAGEICWDANYVYVAVAANTWKRAALSSW